ncbi:MAG: hypothetical protein ACOX0X_02615 [Candidatus Dojkabacteria bacterium]
MNESEMPTENSKDQNLEPNNATDQDLGIENSPPEDTPGDSVNVENTTQSSPLETALQKAKKGENPDKTPYSGGPGVLIGDKDGEQALEGEKLTEAEGKAIEAANNAIDLYKKLQESHTGNPHIYLYVKNLTIGAGNIINNIEDSKDTDITITTRSDSSQQKGVEEVPEKPKGEGQPGNNVEELEKLNKVKKNLNKELDNPGEQEKVEEKTNELIKQTEEVIEEDQLEQAGEVTELTEKDKEEIKEAGKTKEGFMATITRMFSGRRWQGIVANMGMSVASALAVSKVAGVAIATLGPVGVGIVGTGMIGLGALGIVKTVRALRETARSQNMGVIEFIRRDRNFALGAVLGAATSGFTRIGFPALIPGIGPWLPALGVGIETAVSAYGEVRLNRQQQELVDTYLSTFEARRYTRLKEAGYIAREGLNFNKILSDMTDEKLSESERRTAQKVAIATLAHLYNQTKDEKYRYIHYTTKEQEQDVRKQIDVTTIGITEAEDSTAEYPTLQLSGINFENFADRLDVTELQTLASEAFEHSSLDRKELTNEIISYLVGIEATDVENLLSEERCNYFQSVAFLTGFRTASTFVNSAIVIGSGASLTAQAVQSFRTSATEQGYRTELGDSDAEVRTYTREDGTTVNTIDLDSDGTPDLVHDTSTNQYSATNTVGAEKLFEIQNSEFGNVNFNGFDSTSTGIEGTLVTDSGEVVGVVYHDTNGNLGVLTSSQLNSALSATNTTNGSPLTMNISNIQADGTTTINIGNEIYTTNLSNLSGIPEIPGTEGGLGVDPLTSEVLTGDSVPRVLTKIMQQAKEFNPNLAQYDDYELQRSLYKGDMLTNDSTIRSEFGFTNPVQPGQEYSVRNSPTIMGWLEDLNGGPISLPDVESGSPSSPGSAGINFDFGGPNIDSISLENLAPETGDITVGHLGTLVAAGVGLLTPEHVGGIIKTSKIEFFDQEEEPDPTPPSPIPPKPTPEQEREYIKQILTSQIFAYKTSKKSTTKVITGTKFTLGKKDLLATEHGWMLGKELLHEKEDIERLVNEFLDLPKKEQAELLTKILGKMTTTKGQGRRVMLAESIVFRKIYDEEKKEFIWVEYSAIKNEEKEVITSKVLADRILLIKRDDKGDIIEPTADATPQQAEASTTAQQAEASATIQNAEANAETNERIEKFKGVLGHIVNALQNANQPIFLNNLKYTYHNATKLWKVAEGRNENSKDLKTEDVLEAYSKNYDIGTRDGRSNLRRDIINMLGNINKVDYTIQLGDKKYTRFKDNRGNLAWRSGDKGHINDTDLAYRIVGLGLPPQQPT